MTAEQSAGHRAGADTRTPQRAGSRAVGATAACMRTGAGTAVLAAPRPKRSRNILVFGN